MTAAFSADDRLRVTYRLLCGEGETPRDKAEDIAYEQTVELPPACVGDAIIERVVGRVESVETPAGRQGSVVISFAPEWIGGDAAQLANVLFGGVGAEIVTIQTTSLDQEATIAMLGSDVLPRLRAAAG